MPELVYLLGLPADAPETYLVRPVSPRKSAAVGPKWVLIPGISRKRPSRVGARPCPDAVGSFRKAAGMSWPGRHGIVSSRQRSIYTQELNYSAFS